MKLFLAGSDSGDAKVAIKKRLVDNAFLSYYYLRKKADLDFAFYREHIKTIIIDSGAHTFFSELQGQGLSVSVHVKKSKTKETPDIYWEHYKEWLIKYHTYFDYFVELDIGEIVGQEKVLKWREELKELGLYKQCITCYHPRVISWKAYLEMLDGSQSRYCAVEGERPGRGSLPYGKLLKEAWDRKVKIHGFALIKKRLLEKYPFYSADSTSWKAGNQYGAVLSSVNGNTKTTRFKGKKVLNIKNGGLIDLFSKNKEVARQKSFEISTKAYNKYEAYLTSLWKSRGIIYEDNN
jgi:hypothetical protein